MWRLGGLIFIVAALCALGGCSQKLPPLEPLPEGGNLIRASASTLLDPAGAAQARAEQDAVKFCRRDGRLAKVREVKTELNRDFNRETAELVFDCVPVAGRPHS